MKLILKWFALVLFVMLLGVLVYVLPAHMQVRGVVPPLPDDTALMSLLDVENKPISVRYINTSSQISEEGTLGHTVFIIEWANGNIFMIDSGMDEAHTYEFGELMEMLLRANPVVFHGTVQDQMGSATDQLRGLGFTHLHPDHTQGAQEICTLAGDKLQVFQSKQQSEMHNMHTEEGAAYVNDSCANKVGIDADSLTQIDGFPGLAMYSLGGHTPGSTLFAVAVNEQLFLFSGDTTNTKAELLQDRGKGLIYSYLLIPENTSRTGALRRWLRALDARDNVEVIVSHDIIDIEARIKPLP